MIKTATAVKARIRNKAQGDSNKSQVLLRIYMMERLLERLSVSKYRDNFVLKGGTVSIISCRCKYAFYNGY